MCVCNILSNIHILEDEKPHFLSQFIAVCVCVSVVVMMF